MPEPQPYSNEADGVRSSQERAAVATFSASAKSISIDTVGRQKPLSSTESDQVDKLVNRFSSWGTLFQSIISIPGFIIQLYFGINYLNQCSIQPLINIFLIVNGCLILVNGIVLLIGFITAHYIKRSSSPSTCPRYLINFLPIGQGIWFLAHIGWFIAGQVWVFGTQRKGFQSNDSTERSTYCNKSVFWSAFTTIIVTYGIFLILILAFVIGYIVKRHKATQESATTIGERI